MSGKLLLLPKRRVRSVTGNHCRPKCLRIQLARLAILPDTKSELTRLQVPDVPATSHRRIPSTSLPSLSPASFSSLGSSTPSTSSPSHAAIRSHLRPKKNICRPSENDFFTSPKLFQDCLQNFALIKIFKLCQVL